MGIESLASATVHALALGVPQPPQSPHAVSVSYPTWQSVISWGKREKWVMQKMQTGYPRFFIHRIIQKLSRDVLTRLQTTDDGTSCMIFPTQSGAARCLAELKASDPDDSVLEIARFALPSSLRPSGSDDAYWTTFYAVLYPTSLSRDAAAFWRDTGDGITSRHAEYCHARLDYLESESANISLRTQPLKSNMMDAGPSLTPIRSAFAEKRVIESFIAKLATSEQAGQPCVSFRDVFLYSKGMSAVSAVARALASLSDKSDAVAYG
ncbi:hypothetical protein GJ744_003643 [Endocarpon pusillum]|uniref:Uncharacterized protein n=1 Tax=Endocarpon pusillum TaxID=364733 RepID=A0A8H7E1Z7_9EURO|nr:hypothetical protein GJ744_003643 [Endocarpon pusillum]